MKLVPLNGSPPAGVVISMSGLVSMMSLTNANHQRLSKTGLCCLINGFVCQSTGSGDDANPSSLMYEAWHDTNLTLSWSDDTRTVRSYQSGLALCFEHVCDTNHIVLWDAFGDADLVFLVCMPTRLL